MSEREGFERILASLHEAALDPACWPSASALIDEALGTHGNSLACGDGESEEDYRIYFTWVLLRGQRHQELERLWYETYFPLDERISRLRRLPYNQLFHVTSLYTDEELKTSEAYNALRTYPKAGNGINVRLDGPNGSRIFWEINDPVDGEGWSSAQLDTIRRLLPHVRQTVNVRQTLAGANALGATMAELLEVTGLGIIQLDARGQILVANDRARDVLRTGDGLFDERRLLYARMSEDNDDLQELLGRALPPFGARGAGGSTTIRRSGGLPPLVLHVHPVDSQETDFQVWPVAALVLVVDPANGAVIDPKVAAEAFGLTRMEGRVAALLARGMSVSEISVAAGRKESTIRWHVKRMLAKHGFSRQTELVRLVQSVAASPEARSRK